MSRIRNIANLFSGNTDAATDAELTAAISSHNTAANGHMSRGNTSSRPNSPSIGDVYSNTETGFIEVYSGSTFGWEQIGGISSEVTNVVATNQPSNRGFNNGQASISFTPGTILGRSYTVTSNPGNITATGSSSPIIITGLQSNIDYTYTVVSTNNYGSSSSSAPSSSVKSTTVPEAITSVSAVKGNTEATISFTTNANGGSEITSYTVTSNPGNITATGSSSPIVVTGLTNGTEYTFTVTATNSNGASSSSLPSNAITPTLPPSVSGGTLYSDSTYYYRKFTSTGNLTISNSDLTADLLVIAGGGGGGRNKAGGGGAGTVVYATNQSLVGSYTLTIGAGGTRETSGGAATNGVETSIGSLIVASGGGKGGNEGTSGASGGSGGAGGRFGGAGLKGTYSGIGTAYLNDGAAGQGNSSPYRGGGGGGSGSAGTSGGGGGHGGAGLSTWSTWATVTSSGVSGFFAGGGGGGAYGGAAGSAGSGGAGSGTNHSGTNDNGGIGGSATANTGSGGGGGGNVSDGGTGGSGIIIIRYLKSLVDG